MRLNLLPPGNKALLVDQHTFYVARSLYLFWFVAMVVLVGGLWGISFSLERRNADLSERLLSQQAATAQNGRNARTKIRTINQKLSFLRQHIQTPLPMSALLATIATKTPSEVTITALTVTKTGDIQITGTAVNRTSFLTFKEQLESSGMLTNITSPLSNILTPENIQFKLTATAVLEDAS